MQLVAYEWFRQLFITAGTPQPVADPVERRGHALRLTNLVLLRDGVPVEFEGLAFRAVRLRGQR